MAEDDIVQLIEDPGDKPAEQGPRWKTAVIDDEPAVHDGTRFALADYRLNGQGSRSSPPIRRPRGASSCAGIRMWRSCSSTSSWRATPPASGWWSSSATSSR